MNDERVLIGTKPSGARTWVSRLLLNRLKDHGWRIVKLVKVGEGPSHVSGPPMDRAVEWQIKEEL